jgi:hypothetical protein
MWVALEVAVQEGITVVLMVALAQTLILEAAVVVRQIFVLQPVLGMQI